MDDILGEESDNESEGRGKEKPGNEEMEDEEEQQQRHQQAGAGQTVGRRLGPQALSIDERLQTPSNVASQCQSVSRWGTELFISCRLTPPAAAFWASNTGIVG